MAIKGMKLNKALQYLEQVKKHERCIPFRRFNGGVGRTSQANEFKTTQGRWPEKSIELIEGLLKNASSNAGEKQLDLESLIISHVQVNQAPKGRRRTYRAHGRINAYLSHPCHVEIVLTPAKTQVEKPVEKGVVKLDKRRLAARQRAIAQA
jgi:large subunit ribosomal protein L17e